ncbi:hypothetical protein ABC347_15535 [Sphingomonas sp. 1P06PA]|uniref:hypothetical protein n=1 Tax=Sphingomonas sp. 1P06PA TaxID=554121 RepID=UPI0039A780AE
MSYTRDADARINLATFRFAAVERDCAISTEALANCHNLSALVNGGSATWAVD